jgi:hypothetical protein
MAAADSSLQHLAYDTKNHILTSVHGAEEAAKLAPDFAPFNPGLSAREPLMIEKPPVTDKPAEATTATATPAGTATVPPPPRRPGHRGADVRDTVAEMAARAQEISLEAGSKIAAAMKDVIGAAAGLTGFALESARDLVQYMVRRGQMTQDEADKLLREVEESQGTRRPSVVPARPVQARPEPIRTEPPRAEPARAEPARAELARTESARTEPDGKKHPAAAAPVSARPAKPAHRPAAKAARPRPAKKSAASSRRAKPTAARKSTAKAKKKR